PRWGDDRHEARRALAEAVASGGAVAAAGGARGQPEHERERARVMAALPLVQRALFALRLSRARSLAWRRGGGWRSRAPWTPRATSSPCAPPRSSRPSRGGWIRPRCAPAWPIASA